MRIAQGMTTLIAVMALAVSLAAQGSLTPQDRAEIQELSAKYARTLGSCAAEEYADLFAPDTGYFASNFRGEVVGRERLMALVRSERHCTAPAPQPSGNASASPRPVPTVAIEISSTGPTGRADLGEKVGRYDDEYVKTPKGWRFKSRTVMTAQELAAGLTVQDVRTIRRLAGTDLGQFDDVYAAGTDGVKRFQSVRCGDGVVRGGCDGACLPEEQRRSLRGRVCQNARRRVAFQVPGARD